MKRRWIIIYLRADPDQLANLAEDPEYGEILAAMRKRCDELKESLALGYTST